ncbi:MAG: FadR/GntR family transcriptional regulator [Bacillota bacterium]
MPGFHPIRTERIYQKIVDQIREMLNSGQLHPGDRLPSEREIADQLQVSRPAVREAFSALEMMGLIEVRPGEGTFVKSGDLITPFALLLSMEGDTTQAREMMEIRIPLEGQAAYLAALRATAQDLVKIEHCLLRMERDLKEDDLGQGADWEFHMAVAMASHNSLLTRVMYHLQDALKVAVETARHRLFRIRGMPERLLMEHREVYEAIRARDPERARTAMMHHITQAMNNSDL